MPRLLSLLPALCLLAQTPAQEAPDQPNILFLFADDYAPEALGAIRGDFCDTPNLNALAARGTLIPDAINPGAWGGAVCVASRAMLLTGFGLEKAERQDNQPAWEAMVEAGALLPQRLSAVGYHTAFVGKWHNPTHPSQSFEETGTVRPGMPAKPHEIYSNTQENSTYYHRPNEAGENTWDPTDESLGGHFLGGRHWAEVAADEANEILGRCLPQEQPLFLMVSFNSPHDPRQSPTEFYARHPIDKETLPLAFATHATVPPAILRIRDELEGPYPRTEQTARLHRAEYAAIVEHLDAQIGRILEVLEASGEQDNTLVVFSADHGLAMGNHGLLGKQNLYQHSTTAPLILAGPGVPEERLLEHSLACIQDVHPTFLNAAGAEAPSDCDFLPLQPLLDGDASRLREAIDTRFSTQLAGHREGEMQLIWNRHLEPDQPGALELYDLAADPLQLDNLAADPYHRRKVQRLLTPLLEAVE